MRKQLLATMLAAALPLAALAQGGPPAGGQGQNQAGPGAKGAGPGGFSRGSPEAMEKRMRLARTLGLAEALDLEPAAALKLGEIIGKFDDRRLGAHKALHDARDVLRRAAQGEKVTAAEVDQAIQKSLDARTQLQAIDRETVQVVTQGLSPEKKARAVLFLARFQSRFGPGMGPGMHRGMGHGMGPGMGPGRGRGQGQGPGGGWGTRRGACEGMGPGACGPMMGMAPGMPGADFDDEPED